MTTRSTDSTSPLSLALGLSALVLMLAYAALGA